MAPPDVRSQRWRAAAAGAACAAAFAGLAITLHPRPGRLDGAVLDWFVDHRAAWLTQAAKAVTTIGSPVAMIIVAVGVAVALARRRAPRPWLPVAIAVVANIFESRLKSAFGRDRPPIDLRLLRESSFAFPSGHATMSMTVLGMVAVLAPRLAGRPVGRAVRIALVGAALLVGCSRLYLGVHWLSDVVGGALLGGAFVALLAGLTAGDGASEQGRPVQPLGSRSE